MSRQTTRNRATGLASVTRPSGVVRPACGLRDGAGRHEIRAPDRGSERHPAQGGAQGLEANGRNEKVSPVTVRTELLMVKVG